MRTDALRPRRVTNTLKWGEREHSLLISTPSTQCNSNREIESADAVFFYHN